MNQIVSSQFKSCFSGKKMLNREGHEDHEEKNFILFMVNFSLVLACPG